MCLPAIIITIIIIIVIIIIIIIIVIIITIIIIIIILLPVKIRKGTTTGNDGDTFQSRFSLSLDSISLRFLITIQRDLS